MGGPIIFGVDDSESAKEAARVARGLVGEIGLGLVFVRVAEAEASDAKVSVIAEQPEQLSADANDGDRDVAWLVESARAADRLRISSDVSHRPPCQVVVPPGAHGRVNGRRDEYERACADFDLAGGIARFGLGGGGGDFAGGLARFNLVAAEARPVEMGPRPEADRDGANDPS
jgi:hypothetical protein